MLLRAKRTLKTIHKRSKDKARNEDLRKQMLGKCEVDSNTDKRTQSERSLSYRIKFESLILAQDERWRRA